MDSDTAGFDKSRYLFHMVTKFGDILLGSAKDLGNKIAGTGIKTDLKRNYKCEKTTSSKAMLAIDELGGGGVKEKDGVAQSAKEKSEAIKDAFAKSRYSPSSLALWMVWMQCLKMVKLHGVPVTTFCEDGLSVIATKLGTSLMLESYTSDMYMQYWGRSSYARAMIEVQADVELKDNIVAAMPKITREGYYTYNIRVEYKWKPPSYLREYGVWRQKGYAVLGIGQTHFPVKSWH
ncbi:hypothetical protein Tco_0266579 [Tanacetum coccineum]